MSGPLKYSSRTEASVLIELWTQNGCSELVATENRSGILSSQMNCF